MPIYAPHSDDDIPGLNCGMRPLDLTCTMDILVSFTTRDLKEHQGLGGPSPIVISCGLSYMSNHLSCVQSFMAMVGFLDIPPCCNIRSYDCSCLSQLNWNAEHFWLIMRASYNLMT